MCNKEAAEWKYGYCPLPDHKPPIDKSLITRVKESKHWGFCSNKLCNLKNDNTNVLKETQLLVLPAKHCAIFNSSTLAYNSNIELCAGKKRNYPTMPVYHRGVKRKGKYTYKYTGKKTNYVSIQILIKVHIF